MNSPDAYARHPAQDGAVNCSRCSTELIPGAGFCAECGLPSSAVVRRSGTATHDAVVDDAICDGCGAELLETDIFCGECGRVSVAVGVAFTGPLTASSLVRNQPDAPAEPVPDRSGIIVDDPWDGVPATTGDLDATRTVSSLAGGQRFLLRFSTGQNVAVSGAGLIGRSPLPAPGEQVDQLVRVIDPTTSVSKTHLEFGQAAGHFWVRDLYSGNGSALSAPGGSPRRCRPGTRYPVSRGSRIDFGDQFVIVS